MSKDDGPKPPKEPQSFVAFFIPTSLLLRFDDVTGARLKYGVRPKVIRRLITEFTEAQESLTKEPPERV